MCPHVVPVGDCSHQGARRINNHKVLAERGCCVVEVNLVVNKVPCQWALLEDFNNPNDE